MTSDPKLFLALPVMNESQNIQALMGCLEKQSFKNYELVVCVNQYDSWWTDERKRNICVDNEVSLNFFHEAKQAGNIEIIDKSSPGNGWKEKKGGVGYARRVIMDNISARSANTDIIVSIDADTYYPENYLLDLVRFFGKNQKLMGLAIPYYHTLLGDDTDRLILRYEIYMRYFLLNMLRINNPFAFTALGSAMAFPVWAYRKVGGLTPVAAGEDFYFLQKLVKTGSVGIWTDTIAYPSSRFSDRVVFGTGPALIKGNNGDWESYPIYGSELFNEVDETYKSFEKLYYENISTPLDEFNKEIFGRDDIWSPLRENYKDVINFRRACVNKIDGLRILQFLRWRSKGHKGKDERNLYDFLHRYFYEEMDDELINNLLNFDYQDSELQLLTDIRDLLFRIEMKVRKEVGVIN